MNRKEGLYRCTKSCACVPGLMFISCTHKNNMHNWKTFSKKNNSFHDLQQPRRKLASTNAHSLGTSNSQLISFQRIIINVSANCHHQDAICSGSLPRSSYIQSVNMTCLKLVKGHKFSLTHMLGVGNKSAQRRCHQIT